VCIICTTPEMIHQCVSSVPPLRQHIPGLVPSTVYSLLPRSWSEKSK